MRSNINRIAIDDYITTDKQKHFFNKKYKDDFLYIGIELNNV